MPSVAPPVPARLGEILDDLATFAHRVVFVDASALAVDPHETPTKQAAPVSLCDMADPHRAAGNCRAATKAVNDHLSTALVAVGLRTGVAQAWFDSGTSQPGHFASTVTLPDGSVWTLDFTARQFDPAAPVPLVLEAGEWMSRLAVWAQAWGWRVQDTGVALGVRINDTEMKTYGSLTANETHVEYALSEPGTVFVETGASEGAKSFAPARPAV